MQPVNPNLYVRRWDPGKYVIHAVLSWLGLSAVIGMSSAGVWQARVATGTATSADLLVLALAGAWFAAPLLVIPAWMAWNVRAARRRRDDRA